MGRIWMPGGGGGADLDVVTAGAGDVLAGKVIVDKDGNPLTGTIPDNTGTALEVATNGKTLIPKGYFDGTTYVTNTQATMAGGTKTPTTSAQTIACNGKLMTSNIVIPAFTMPAASSIKKGTTVTIYGKSVTGTLEATLKGGEGSISSSTYKYDEATGNGSYRYMYRTTISGLGFIPRLLVVYGYGGATIFADNYTYNNHYYVRIASGDDDIWVYSSNSSYFLISESKLIIPVDASSIYFYLACY